MAEKKTKATVERTPAGDSKKRRAVEICERAWSSLELGDKSALIRFTRGILKLPADHWTSAGMALWYGDWRSKQYPIAYIRSVTIHEHQRQFTEDNAGKYLSRRPGDSGARPVLEMEVIPYSQRHGDCKVLAAGGDQLEIPRIIEAPQTRQKKSGYLMPLSQISHWYRYRSDADDSDNPNENLEQCVLDAVSFKDYWREVSCPPARYLLGLYDWNHITSRAGLDAEESVLLKAQTVNSDDKCIRRGLGWNYERFRRVEKRLLRKLHVLRDLLALNFLHDVRKPEKLRTT